MWKYNTPDELYHYGIRGMKWGHRKTKNGILSKIKNNYKFYKEANKKDKSIKIATIIGGSAVMGAGGIYGFSLSSGISTLGMKKASKALNIIGNSLLSYSSVKGVYNYEKAKSEKNKNAMSMKKKILIGTGITTALIGSYFGSKKLLKIKSKKDILKRYPIEKIKGLGLDADYAKHYLEKFKKIHNIK